MSDKIYEVTSIETSKNTSWMKMVRMSEFINSIVHIECGWSHVLYVTNSIKLESGKKRRDRNYMSWYEMPESQLKQVSEILNLGFIVHSGSEYLANPDLCWEIFKEKAKQFNARPKIYSDTKSKVKIKVKVKT